MLQNQTWPRGTYINSDFVNVINSTKMRYRSESSEETGNKETKN